jgi:hypothetical protein
MLTTKRDMTSVCLASAVVAALVFALPAHAQNSTAEASPAISVCVHAATGSLRLVSGNEDCRRSENRVNLNFTGPAGPAGPQGPQGADGTPAPAGGIRGQLTSCEPGADLSHYLVYVPGRGFIAFTDAAGAFQIDNVPAGLYDLNVARSGNVVTTVAGIDVSGAMATLSQPIEVGNCSPPQLQCTVTDQCAAGAYCVNGACEETSVCSNDGQCAIGLTCDESRSTCVPALPPPPPPPPPPACSTFTDQASCEARTDCRAVIGGTNCHRPDGTFCQAGDASCVCEPPFTFQACVPRG